MGTPFSSIQASLDGYDEGERFHARVGSMNYSVPAQKAFSEC